LARTTFNGILRSRGGGKQSVCPANTVVLVTPFHITTDALIGEGTPPVQRSSTNTDEVILPANAVVIEVHADGGATGGTSPDFDLGWAGVNDSSAADADGLVDGAAGDSAAVVNVASATAGNDLLTVMSATQPVKITGNNGGSAPTGGTISGIIKYYVDDDGRELR